MKLNFRLGYKLILITLLFISGLIIAGIIFPVLGIVSKPTPSKSYRDALKLMWLNWFKAILGLQIRTTGNAPDFACLTVSNHISWLDIIVLGCFSPAHFVAKSDILLWPVIGYLARQGGTIFVRRGDKNQIKAIAEEIIWLLKQNNKVIVFPEGTTTNGDSVLPFHASLFQSALLTRAVVQPVAIQYEGAAKNAAAFIGDDAFVPHLIKMLSFEKIEAHVCFLPTINTTGKQRLAVSNEARATIMESIVGEEFAADIALQKKQ